METGNLKGYKGKILLQKRYFDLGYGITSYAKLLIALFGISSLDVKATMILGLSYGIFCYVFGWAYVKYGWYTVDIEIANKFNLFVREMRSKIK